MRYFHIIEKHPILFGCFLGIVLLFCTECFSYVIDPSGALVPYHGGKEFQPSHISQQITKDALVITIRTKLPLTKLEYNKSDLVFKVNETTSYAVKLAGRDKGHIVLNPKWVTSEVFKEIGEFCRYPDGDYILVKASGGEFIGKACVFEKQVGPKDYQLQVIIPLKFIGGKTGVVEYASGLCDNSVSNELFTAPSLPSFQTSPAYNIDPSFKNDNPVVPYWSGPAYFPSFGYGGGWGGWDGGYQQNNNYYIIKPCKPCPTVPAPRSMLLLGAGLIYMILRG